MFRKPSNKGTFATILLAMVAVIGFGAIAAEAAIEGTALITSPVANARISGSVTVRGTATAANFQFYKLEFGEGASPSQWAVIEELHETQVTNDRLGIWDVNALPLGPYTLKLTVVDHTGNWIESSVTVTVGAASIPPRAPTRTPSSAATTPSPTADSSNPCALARKPITNMTLVPLAVRPAVADSSSQAGRASIQGRILDASGRGLCGLTVRVTRGGFEQRATTLDDGGYLLADLEPGTYTVVVEQQISTPVAGLNLAAGQALQVDFVQIRPTTPTVAPTGTHGPSPTATTTKAATPTPVAPTATASPTPFAPRDTAGPFDVWRWWGWLGFELDLEGLASHLYLGIMGGLAVFALGVVIALVRR